MAATDSNHGQSYTQVRSVTVLAILDIILNSGIFDRGSDEEVTDDNFEHII